MAGLSRPDGPTGLEPAKARFPLSLIFQAARMYFLEDATQVQIAARLNVSRPTVSRLISEARRIGIIKIEVLDPFQDQTLVLAEELRDALGLKTVYLAAVTNPATLGSDLMAPTSRAITDMQLTAGDAMLLSSGRTTYEIAHALDLPLPGVEIAPAVGGQAEPLPWFQTNETTRVAAERTGANPNFVFAQALPTERMRESLDEDPTFRQVGNLWASAKGALLSIGAPPSKRTSLSRGIPAGLPTLEGAAGDVCLNFFDTDGNEVEFAGSRRLVKTSRAELRQLPHAVGVAVGQEKVQSILGAIRAGLINELVSDADTAKLLLENIVH